MAEQANGREHRDHDTASRARRGRPAGIVVRGPGVKRERLRRGVTRDELALAIGVNPRTIQRAENGQPVSHRVVHGLSEFLGLSFEILRDSMSRDEIAQSA